MGKLNAILVIAMPFVLAAPCITLAEDVTLNYGSIKHEYKPQNDDGTKRDAASGLPTGKRMHKPITITKEVSPASTKSHKHIGAVKYQ